MSLIDQLAEKHILAALHQGDLDNLPGTGHPLKLDDDSHVPEELRASYRILKNSGYLPPELEMRREAVELDQLLGSVNPLDEQYLPQLKRLRLLELKLKQAGISTDFLQGDYSQQIHLRFNEVD
ncbi:DUF1992 domain-containing protein [Erwinia piriflorinigrans]|uniref:DnaJ homologue subfamily C member 28 conserved domain-containing protein n=1 Tax=Erwinia piriflorinigrans CFBP 5888 TaxID=1161919 RepID=V5ZCY2_9GAMM|nr:DUF1992 domain-containing protein [Erwinia piriflorinigrans]CCG88801.1 putative protein yhdN [Erwinia piriflorinigrans CFBP 5888]